MSEGVELVRSQSSSPPTLTQFFAEPRVLPQPRALTDHDMQRNDSVMSSASMESVQTERVSDTEPEAGNAGGVDGLECRVHKRQRTESDEHMGETTVQGRGQSGSAVQMQDESIVQNQAQSGSAVQIQSEPDVQIRGEPAAQIHDEMIAHIQGEAITHIRGETITHIQDEAIGQIQDEPTTQNQGQQRPAIAQERQSRFFSSEGMRTGSESAAALASNNSDSDSDDFAEPAAQQPRPQPLPWQPPTHAPPPTPEPASAATDAADDRNTCSVCLEPWTISGAHRVISLKCGHLFGQSCAKKWLRKYSLKHRRRGTKIIGKCPECNQESAWSDVRPIYARSITAVDGAVLDELRKDVAQLNETRLRLEDQRAELRMDYMKMHVQVERLRKELDESVRARDWLELENVALRRRVEEHEPSERGGASGNDPGTSDKGPGASDNVLDGPGDPGPRSAYVPRMRLRAAIPMTVQAQESSRLLVVHPHEPLVYASYSKPSLRMHTLAQIDMHSASGKAFLLDLPHKQEIRGAEVSPHATGARYMLTASLDQTAAVTSLGYGPSAAAAASAVTACVKRPSPMLAVTLGVRAPCWSCAWDQRDANLCYVGTTSGRVVAFDLRRADAPVRTWNGPQDGVNMLERPEGDTAISGGSVESHRLATGYSPIHSIITMADGRLLVANSNGLFLLPSDPSAPAWTQLTSPSSRSCFSASYDAQQQCLAASFRTQRADTRAPSTEHELFDVGSGMDADWWWRRRRASITVPSPQTKMARTSVFSYAVDSGARRQGLFCAGVEATRLVKAWDVDGCDNRDVLALSGVAASEDIVDVRGWQWDDGDAMFASLTNTTVRLYDVR